MPLHSQTVDRASIFTPELLFCCLFAFRYVRLIVHIIYFRSYRPTPISAKPKHDRLDCTVIIPTVEPQNEDFRECIESVLANTPGAVIVVTVGSENLKCARDICAPYGSKVLVTATNVANKRQQVCHALPKVDTAITLLVDDHVFWPSENFLPTVLAPFDDPRVGVVGTNKRVRRFHNDNLIKDFWNFIGCLYLERHNFEITATNNIDGGVFVISGRTSAHRTCILQDPEFLSGFKNEYFFCGIFGPLNADDDNFITRWEVKNNWKIAIQNSEDAMIETTLGTYPKFLSQCLRWARTTWRSNSASLFTDGTVWKKQPWCVYAVYITSFFNFALLTEPLLFYLLYHSTFAGAANFVILGIWIFASKLVKILPHFTRHPSDLVWLPGQILFGYFHSFIKLMALVTFWDTAWSGRQLVDSNEDH